MVGWIILAAVAALVAVILIRTLLFKPNDPAPMQEDEIALNHEKIVADMADMIRCRTISSKEDSYVDWAEFDKFQALLVERFPAIHAAADLKKLGRTGLLYHLPGESAQNPTVCMAHYDVVPVEEDGWDKPPFEAIIEDGEMWGRGTLDTEGTLCGVMEALEELLNQGFV
ncbi:MAG: M20/M25/M40 family metallo-hydrolase, partial [Oscillospiraceae bacterium]|nr:M20/M25/M40 family metallo-hydrolase [Oscillospiraceae bacterium]